MHRFPEISDPPLMSRLRVRSGPWVSLLFLLLAFGLISGARAVWLSSPVIAQGPWSKAPANELFKPSFSETVFGTKRRFQGKAPSLGGDEDEVQASAVLALLSYWPAFSVASEHSHCPAAKPYFPFPRALRTEPLNPRAPPQTT